MSSLDRYQNSIAFTAAAALTAALSLSCDAGPPAPINPVTRADRSIPSRDAVAQIVRPAQSKDREEQTIGADQLAATVVDLRRALEGGRPITEHTGKLEAWFEQWRTETEKNEAILSALGLEERRAEVHARSEEIAARAETLLAALKNGNPANAALKDELERAFSVATPARRSIAHSAGLNERPSYAGAAPPLGPAGLITAAYQPDLPPPPVDDCMTDPSHALCAETPQGPFSATIIAKAAELGNDPYRIYSFVRDQITFEPYLGVNKGAEAVLQTKRGGPQEQMLLLGTLLRAAGHPTQYAFGWVFAPKDRINAWLGQTNDDAAQTILFTTMAVEQVYDSLGNLAGNYLYLSWVETYVPYGDWLGETDQKRWVPLMPYFDGNDVAEGHPEAVSATPFDEADFLSAVRVQTANEYYVSALGSALAAGNAGYGVSEVPVRTVQQAESLGLLPSSLPVAVVNADQVGRLTGMPGNYLLYAGVQLVDPFGNFLFGQFFQTAVFGLQRITISWAPETPFDQFIIDYFGGLANTPPGYVFLMPELRVDGVLYAQGYGLLYGDYFNVLMYFQQFGSNFSIKDKWVPVGTQMNLGYDAMQFSEAFLAERESGLLATAQSYAGAPPRDPVEAFTGELLFDAGVKYFLDVEKHERQAAELYQFQPLRFPQHLTTETQVQTYYLFDRPYLIVPLGAVLDAWSLSASEVSRIGDDSRRSELTRVKAYASSTLENQLWEHFISVEGISTTKLLQLATQTGMPVFDFAPYTDASTIYSSLNLPFYIEDFVVEACTFNGGRVVVHQSELTVNDWTGTGWFEQYANGFGMLISGGLSASSGGTSGSSSGTPLLDQPSADLSDRLSVVTPGGAGPPRHHGGAGTENPPRFVVTDWREIGGDAENNVEDPVNLASGNLYAEETDIKISSVGYDLEFQRSYNNLLAYNGPTGQHWSSTYDSMVMPTGTPGEVRYVSETGDTQVFVETPPGSGVFIPPAGYHTRIMHSGGAWIHRTPNGFERHHDDVSGRLTLMTDRYGNRRTLSYDGAGNLELVADDYGASLAFSHDAFGRIDSISDHTGRTWTYVHDGDGNLIEVGTPSDSVTPAASHSYFYGPGSQMIGWTDARGGSASVDYYADGKVHRQTLADGRVYTFVYDVYRRETVLTQPEGSQSIHAFNAAGDQIRTINADGTIWEDEFDAEGNVTRTTDPTGASWQRTWDSSGNMLSATPPLSAPRSYTYEPIFNRLSTIADDRGVFHSLSYAALPGGGELITETDAIGAQKTWTVDSRGLIVSMTDDRSNTMYFGYDARGRLETYTDRNGNITTYSYDDANRLISRVLADGTPFTYTYDARDRLLSARADGVAFATLTYDAASNVLSETNAVGSTWSYSYDPTNYIDTMTLPDGTAYTYFRDGRKQLTGMIDPAGGLHSWTYDVNGRLSATIDPAGHVSSIVRDPRGRIRAEIDPLGRITTYEHDAESRVTRTDYPDGSFESFEYDSHGQNVTTIDRGGGVTSMEYDARLELVQVVDPMLRVHSFVHDAARNVVQVNGPLGQVTMKTYDAEGNLETLTDANGNTSTYTYDDLNHVTSRTVTDAGGTILDVISMNQDFRGNLLAVANANSGLSFARDGSGRLTGVTTAATAFQPATSINYTYDSRNELASRTDFGTHTISFTRNAVGQATAISDGQAGSTSIAYDARGVMISQLYPNGATVGYDVDAASQVTAIMHRRHAVDLGSLAYDYDSAGNISARHTSAGTDTYTYDALRRVTSAVHPASATEIFNYDADGNWTATAVSSSYTVDGANRLIADGQYVYSYDANGNRTRRELLADATTYTAYAYDYDNRLTRVTEVQSGWTTRVSQLTYDALGRCIQKDVGGTITRYVYDQWNIVAELDASNAVVTRYVFGEGTDQPIAMIRGGQSYYYHQDAVGSVVAISDASGNVVQRYAYNTYGERIAIANPSFVQPFGFAGREQDETGLVRMRMRDYDPVAGRFIQQDPLGLTVGVNIYGYAGGNPIGFNDPFGLWTWGSLAKSFAQGVVAGVVGAVVVAGAAALAVTLGAPIAAVTTVLFVAGAVGAAVTAVNVASDITTGNWDGVAYNAGGIVGGIIGGGTLGNKVATAINPNATPGWSLGRDVANRYQPNYPGGSFWKWMGTGPDGGAAAAALGASGSGVAGGLEYLGAPWCGAR